MTDPDPTDARLVEDWVRSGRASAPRDVDARVRASLDACEVSEPALDASPRSPAGRWWAAALLLAGVGVVVWSMTEGRRDDARGANDRVGRAAPVGPRDPNPADPHPVNGALGDVATDGAAVAVDGPQDPAPAAAAGMMGDYSAAQTLKLADAVVLIEVEALGASLRAKVLRVYHGDAALTDESILIEPIPFNGRLGALPSTFLDRVEMRHAPAAPGQHWLLALAAVAGSEHKFRNAVGEGIRGTPVAHLVHPAAIDDPLGAIQDVLLATLDDPEPVLRRGAIAALRHWDGMNPRNPGDTLWRDPAVVRRLCELSSDVDKTVRWTLAWSIPRGAGDAGLDALWKLAFDSDRQVRQPAFLHLVDYGVLEGDIFTGLEDYELDEHLGGLPEVVASRIQQMRLQTVADALDTTQGAGMVWALRERDGEDVHELLAQAARSEVWQVRRAAAAALQSRAASRAGAGELLLSLFDDAEPRVAVMAAAAAFGAGDDGGRTALLRLARHEDLRVATQAVDLMSLLAPAANKVLLDDLSALSRDPRPWVRAFAAAGIGRCRSVAVHQVDALLGDLRKDPDPLVRAAAR